MLEPRGRTWARHGSSGGKSYTWVCGQPTPAPRGRQPDPNPTTVHPSMADPSGDVAAVVIVRDSTAPA